MGGKGWGKEEKRGTGENAWMRFRVSAPFVKIFPPSCASLRGSQEISVGFGVGYGANHP